jgi:hypothetical protein
VKVSMFNSEIALLKRTSWTPFGLNDQGPRDIERAPVYQRLCCGSDPRKNVQAGMGWALRDQIPNWTH